MERRRRMLLHVRRRIDINGLNAQFRNSSSSVLKFEIVVLGPCEGVFYNHWEATI
jgi:hypothetical protein